MEYEKYSMVKEHISDETANKYLDAGWKLLFVGQLNDGEYQNTSFVVGWPVASGKPIIP